MDWLQTPTFLGGVKLALGGLVFLPGYCPTGLALLSFLTVLPSPSPFQPLPGCCPGTPRVQDVQFNYLILNFNLIITFQM